MADELRVDMRQLVQQVNDFIGKPVDILRVRFGFSGASRIPGCDGLLQCVVHLDVFGSELGEG